MVSKSPDINLVGLKWMFKIKLKADRTKYTYKTRLVAREFSQLEGIDFEEIFIPVVKPQLLDSSIHCNQPKLGS